MTLDTSKKLKVFLCHAANDKAAVRVLYKALLNSGIDAWLDEEKLLPGQVWDKEIIDAVENADAIMVCLSQNSIVKEGYVQKEIKHALDKAEEKPEDALFIIPARIEKCNVPNRLKKWQYVDLYFENGLFPEKGYELLLKTFHNRAMQLGKALPSPIQKSSADEVYDQARAKQKEIEFPKPLPQNFFDIIKPFLIGKPQFVVLSGPSGLEVSRIVQRLKERGISCDIASPIKTGIKADILKKEISKAFKDDKDIVIELEVNVAKTIRQIVPDALLIFVTPENEEDLIRRIVDRKSKTLESLNIQIEAARRDMYNFKLFDFVVVDRDFHLDDTVEKIVSIIIFERQRIGTRRI